MSAIFASLGSNYSAQFVRMALAQLWPKPEVDLDQLGRNLTDLFPGEIYFMAKGRDAIEQALLGLGLQPHDGVLTQALSCWAVESGIVRAGGEPIYYDLAPGKITPSLESIQKSFSQAKTTPKFIIFQHTLGMVGKVDDIVSWARGQNIKIIVDLAQSFGAVSATERLGNQADAVVLSFGRDKIIDAVSGGGVIFKSAPKVKPQTTNWPQLTSKQIWKQLTYPFLTWLIRASHPWMIGKILHQFLTKIHWLTNPTASDWRTSAQFPPQLTALVQHQLENLDEQLAHRRQIANLYWRILKDCAQVKLLSGLEDISSGANLRFPVWVTQPNKLAKELAQHQIYLADRWYRAPVDGGKLEKSSYYHPGSCPVAEEMSQHIFNLPTHQYITPQQAEKIVNQIIASA